MLHFVYITHLKRLAPWCADFAEWRSRLFCSRWSRY